MIFQAPYASLNPRMRAVEIIGHHLLGVVHSPILALTGAFRTGLGCFLIFPAMGMEVVQRVQIGVADQTRAAMQASVPRWERTPLNDNVLY